MDYYSFYMGQEFEAYKYLGAHLTGKRCIFRTFAPMAEKIELLLEDQIFPMHRIYDGNFYETEVAEVSEGARYEYRIYGRNKSVVEHMDPYGYGTELRPQHKSIVRRMDDFSFTDQKWIKNRTDRKKEALNIYEVHAGSWKKKGSGDTDWYTYVELAEHLIPYMKENHYNFVEFLPLCEHPSDSSWGYQNTGYFAPTARYGTALELKKAINLFHENKIGVILDFVPAHFALDAYALKKYDGTSLYEYPHEDVGVSEWGSCNFMHSRGEVRSFLQSSVEYWLKEYHFDGIRMDAVSRLIYWQGDERRGENRNAIDFLKYMNHGLKERNKGIFLIAEDSTNYPKVTHPVEKGGLGFDYKWDLGWMHDTLEYFQSPPQERTGKYHKLTFSMMYFKNEQYLLPFSHDEVVHGKATILQKMNGCYEEKFSQAKAMYLFMMMHPGKKLNFMGNEIGHFREWDEKREQDWNLLDYPIHNAFHHYMMELNKLYLEEDAFWEKDYEDEGFLWLDCHSEEKCVYTIKRSSGKKNLIGIFHFGNRKEQYYSIKLDTKKKLKLCLYTEWEAFGGNISKEETPYKQQDEYVLVKLAPYSGMLFSE